jgi:hypothetical protein
MHDKSIYNRNKQLHFVKHMFLCDAIVYLLHSALLDGRSVGLSVFNGTLRILNITILSIAGIKMLDLL